MPDAPDTGLEVVATTGKVKAALIYAGVAFLVGAATQVLAVLVTQSVTEPFASPSRWAIAIGSGAVAGGLVYALPYLKAVLPAPPVPVTSGTTGATYKAVE